MLVKWCLKSSVAFSKIFVKFRQEFSSPPQKQGVCMSLYRKHRQHMWRTLERQRDTLEESNIFWICVEMSDEFFLIFCVLIITKKMLISRGVFFFSSSFDFSVILLFFLKGKNEKGQEETEKNVNLMLPNRWWKSTLEPAIPGCIAKKNDLKITNILHIKHKFLVYDFG